MHPLELSAEERTAWGEVLSDYEIVSPFPQLGAPVQSLEPGEAKLDDLKRFHGLNLVAPTLVFTLEKLGWARGLAMDGGCFDEHSKQFAAADVTAVIGYEGIAAMGHIDPNETLTINSVRFVSGMRTPSDFRWDKKHKLASGACRPSSSARCWPTCRRSRPKASHPKRSRKTTTRRSRRRRLSERPGALPPGRQDRQWKRTACAA